jgi:hypothetical protein
MMVPLDFCRWNPARPNPTFFTYNRQRIPRC